MTRVPTRRTYRQVDELPAYTDDDFAAEDLEKMAEVDERTCQLAVSERTAEAMIRRVRPVPGTTPGEIVRMLEQEREARVREELKS